MPSILYSTTCYIKNDLYHLRICVDNNDQNSTNTQITTDSSTSIPNDITIDSIIPSLTRLHLIPVNEQKLTLVPREIILDHILSVKQTNTRLNGNRKHSSDISEINNINFTRTSSIEQSRRTSYSTLSSLISTVTVPRISTIRRPPSLARLFSIQSRRDSEAHLMHKTLVKLSYVDVSNSIRWNIKRLEIEVDTKDIADTLQLKVNLCLSTLKQRPHRLLAFVNPFGGKGRARFVYDKTVLPIFEEANIIVKSIYTQRANEAKDYLINEDLNEYDGVICVGGDGMFSELCQGLLLRTSQEAQLNINDPQVNITQPKLRIGIIPAGSTDAIVFGTTGLNDPITSTLQIIVGETLSIDIATIHNEQGFVRFMAAMLAYGFFGDIIHQSDKWRFLGPLRYDVAGFCQFILNRSYDTEVIVTLASSDSSQSTLPMSNVNDGVESSAMSDSQHLTNNTNSETIGNNQIDNTIKVLGKLVLSTSVFCKRHCEKCAERKNHNANKTNSSLEITRRGKYTTINCLNMPCRTAKSKFGISPFVHLGDGSFDVILVKRSWRTGFLRFLWQVANDSRSIENLPNVERYRVSEVVIRPIHINQKRCGNWACDGELLCGNEIKIRIHRQVLNLFASGIQFDNIEENTSKKEKQKTKCGSFFRCKKRKHCKKDINP
ncbi:unnamed protein product [Rotaria sordida]|uniref:DAGKc domain-containing protein n=1 Tax=Rotaria sordida TaxID=392033 RepID=A0A818MMA2_9BILA|nr:unnamed protein product [Rotaria sordida]CAF0995318.1 unnamed protein product [Rotaria sordida]CAF3591965.1 unnamed protein product [Rotaria sordida]